MIRLLFVGDGKRDAVTIPRIVEHILGTKIAEETHAWARLHVRGRGYERKILYAHRVARDRKVQGLVAVVDADRDKPRQRLQALQKGRNQDRMEHPILPTALGEAVPHGEAWLLDDTEAVRQALRLQDAEKIPSLKKTDDPKKTLDQLISESERSCDLHIDVLRDIAKNLDQSRCKNRKTSGFDSFMKDVHSELNPLTEGNL